MTNQQISQEDVLKANIEVHAALANSGEYNQSPHFRPENLKKVREVLVDLISRTPAKSKSKLLDIGCGTGFIVHLVADLVAEVHGIDITEDMMSQIDLTKGNITLTKAQAENIPYEANQFDMATAYSFLDHLLDYRVVLKEAHRVLKPGGIFYSDLNPNRAFSTMLMGIEEKYQNQDLPHSVSREIKGMLHNGELYEEEFGLSEDVLNNAEPEKSLNQGFDTQEVLEFARKIGFSDVKCDHEWFLGQGVLMNSDSKVNLEDVNEYLSQMLPASSGFYKYLRFIFIK